VRQRPGVLLPGVPLALQLRQPLDVLLDLDVQVLVDDRRRLQRDLQVL
jgi:hypothetical protein